MIGEGRSDIGDGDDVDGIADVVQPANSDMNKISTRVYEKLAFTFAFSIRWV